MMDLERLVTSYVRDDGLIDERFKLQELLYKSPTGINGDYVCIFSANDTLTHAAKCVVKIVMSPSSILLELTILDDSGHVFGHDFDHCRYRQLQIEDTLLTESLAGINGIPTRLGYHNLFYHKFGDHMTGTALVLGPLGESLDNVGKVIGKRSKEAKRSLVLGWGRQILKTLTEIHRRKVIHRDIKPGNVILTPDGQVVIIDFGMSIAADALTRPRKNWERKVIMGGTPFYTSDRLLLEDGGACDMDDIASLCYTLEHIEGDIFARFYDSDWEGGEPNDYDVMRTERQRIQDMPEDCCARVILDEYIHGYTERLMQSPPPPLENWVTVLYAYTPEPDMANQQIPLTEDERILVLLEDSDQHPGWLLGRKIDGREGYVPSNYCEAMEPTKEEEQKQLGVLDGGSMFRAAMLYFLAAVADRCGEFKRSKVLREFARALGQEAFGDQNQEVADLIDEFEIFELKDDDEDLEEEDSEKEEKKEEGKNVEEAEKEDEHDEEKKVEEDDDDEKDDYKRRIYRPRRLVEIMKSIADRKEKTPEKKTPWLDQMGMTMLSIAMSKGVLVVDLNDPDGKCIRPAGSPLLPRLPHHVPSPSPLSAPSLPSSSPSTPTTILPPAAELQRGSDGALTKAPPPPRVNEQAEGGSGGPPTFSTSPPPASSTPPSTSLPTFSSCQETSPSSFIPSRLSFAIAAACTAGIIVACGAYFLKRKK